MFGSGFSCKKGLFKCHTDFGWRSFIHLGGFVTWLHLLHHCLVSEDDEWLQQDWLVTCVLLIPKGVLGAKAGIKDSKKSIYLITEGWIQITHHCMGLFFEKNQYHRTSHEMSLISFAIYIQGLQYWPLCYSYPHTCSRLVKRISCSGTGTLSDALTPLTG